MTNTCYRPKNRQILFKLYLSGKILPNLVTLAATIEDVNGGL